MVSHPRRWSSREVDDLLSALDHLPAMVAYWDKDLRNRIANGAYVEWFGRSPAEIYGMHIRDLLGPTIFQLNLPYIRGALAGEPQLFNRTLVDSYGRTRYTQAWYVPHTVGDSVEGFFVLVTDISERVRAEEALAESVANTALLKERQRIAADMHDLVVQSLFGATLQLRTLARDLEPDAAQRAGEVVAQIEEAMSTLRESINGLTRQIAPEKFRADIEEILQKSAIGLGFAPTLTVDGPLSLVPSAVRPEMLAVLQEALSNVTRHAAATAVQVTITTLGPEIRLLVADDGRGVGRVRRSSGLTNMRSRALQLGGSFAVGQNDPRGTIIDWRVPSTSSARAVRGSTVRQSAIPQPGGNAGG